MARSCHGRCLRNARANPASPDAPAEALRRNADPEQRLQ